MPNQVQYLWPSHETPGAVYHWKPSPKLRKAGFSSIKLGTSWSIAVARSIEENEKVKQWKQGLAPFAQVQRRSRWRDLTARFKADVEHYLSKKPKTRREYDSRIRTLERWARDGELLLADLDRQMVIDLRDTLVQDSRPHRTAALLRVLSILLVYGENKGLLPVGLGRNLKIPTPPKRSRRLLRDHLPALIASAEALGHHHIALGITLGFYTMQREGDLLATTEFQLRAIDDLSSDARRALAGVDGKVNGLWLCQEKTEAWVGIPLVPVARAAVETAIAASRERGSTCSNLILYPNEDRPCPDWKFQRDFRAVVSHAIEQARLRQDHELALQLEGNPDKQRDAIQFRDLRRSGMCWLRELRVPVPLIASISGHSIEETQKILDTYMPRDTRAAAEGMGMAVARQAARDAAELEQEIEG